jgi:hypothetical protein
MKVFINVEISIVYQIHSIVMVEIGVVIILNYMHAVKFHMSEHQ